MHPPTSPIQLLVIAAVVLVLFGKGKVSSLMGEVGKGISAFKKGMAASEAEAKAQAQEAATLLPEPPRPADKA